jgi:hypothetical protein
MPFCFLKDYPPTHIKRLKEIDLPARNVPIVGHLTAFEVSIVNNASHSFSDL